MKTRTSKPKRSTPKPPAQPSVPRTGESAIEGDLLARLREKCLALPGTSETVKWGHPTFAAGGRAFAVLDHYQGAPCIAFQADPDTQARLVAADGYFAAPYAGDQGWTCRRAEGGVDWEELQPLLTRSHELAAAPRQGRRKRNSN